MLFANKSIPVVSSIIAGQVDTPELLDEMLQYVNFERGETPVLVGIDAKGQRFLAYGWAPGGDGWKVNCTTDDTHSQEFSIDGIRQCEECGAHDRLPLSHLTFPVAVI